MARQKKNKQQPQNQQNQKNQQQVGPGFQSANNFYETAEELTQKGQQSKAARNPQNPQKNQ